MANGQYDLTVPVNPIVLVSHMADQRSKTFTGKSLLQALHRGDGRLTDPILQPELASYAPRFLGWSVDDGGTSNPFSYYFEMKIGEDAPDSAYSSLLVNSSGQATTYSHLSPKTLCPGTTAGMASGFAEGDEWHFFFMKDSIYRIRMATPATNAAEAARVILRFHLGI